MNSVPLNSNFLGVDKLGNPGPVFQYVKYRGSMLTTQDKHNPGCQRVARLKVSLAQGFIGSERLRYLISSHKHECNLGSLS